MTNLEELYHPTWEVYDSSKIQTFMACPRKYFFEYILGWSSEAPNHDLIFGQAVHEGMAYIMTHEMTEETVEKAYQEFLHHYRKHYSEETDDIFAPKTPQNAFYGFATYVGKYRSQDFFKTNYVEIGGKLSTGKHTIVYKIDSVCEDDNGRIFSFEHKTTKFGFKKVWFDQWLLSLQVGTYSYALRCLFPNVVPVVIINGIAYSKTKVDVERQPVKKTPSQLNGWLLTTNYWIDQIKMEQKILLSDTSLDDDVLSCFPMNPGSCTQYFRVCAFHDFCMAYQNPLKFSEGEPPDGFQRHYWNPLEEINLREQIDLEE